MCNNIKLYYGNKFVGDFLNSIGDRIEWLGS